MKINFFIFLFTYICNAQYYNQLDLVNIDNPEYYLSFYKKKLLKSDNDFEKGLNTYFIAKNFEYLDIEDSAIVYYSKSKVFFKKSNHLDYKNSINLDLHQIVRFLTVSNNFNTHYLDEFFEYSIQTKNQHYLALAYYEKATIELFKIDRPNLDKNNCLFLADSLAKISENLNKGNSKTLEVKLKLLNGGIQTNLKNFDLAKQFYENVINYKGEKKELYHIYGYQNLGYVYILEKNYQKALENLKKAENSPLRSYKIDFLNIIYNQIAIAHERLKNPELALKYKNKKDCLTIILNKKELDKVLILENYKHQTTFQNQKISLLTQKFNQNKILYLSLIFLVFLLALYSFIRWKKEDYRKKTIEHEKLILENEKNKLEISHLQTINELEKTKQIVIEDHIVLKNKTKIYLEELIYIKADDHYLELITLNKKEFVRGKISEMLQELPPNFIQSHRSYIVNINFVTSKNSTFIILKNNIEIPLSRNFIKNFN